MADDPNRKAREMRSAIDQIEGALMGAGELIDIPDRFEESRDDLLVMPKDYLGPASPHYPRAVRMHAHHQLR